MRATFVALLLGSAAALSGCVVAPAYPVAGPPVVRVVPPPPAVVVYRPYRPHYRHHW